MIALMAAAVAFNRSIEAVNYKRQIVFAFFNGESFDALGSRRFVRDMAEWSCTNSTIPKGTNTNGYKICQDIAKTKGVSILSEESVHRVMEAL